MNNQEKFIANSSFEKNYKILSEKKVLEKELLGLLENKNLSRDEIIDFSSKMEIKVSILCQRILEWSFLTKEFIAYASKSSKKAPYPEKELGDMIISFLEEKQKLEPAKIEQELQVVDIPVTPIVPVEPVEEDQKPVATPPQVSKAPSVEPTPVIKTVESIPQPGKINWQEVKRESEVMAIEDLDGDIQTFEKHVKALGVAEKDASGRWQWTGDNKKLVFLGDILGDRGMDGMEITSIIGDLSKQAEKQGGQVDFLCGNHDSALIYFLCKSEKESFNKMKPSTLTKDYPGIWELTKFDPYPDSEFKKINPFSADFENNEKELWQKLYDKMPEIRVNMKSSSEGMNILKNICKIKVAVIHDDSLFCHTDPTIRMIQDLTKDENILERVGEINDIFQKNLQEALFNEKESNENFWQINKIYLNTGNRDYFTENRAFKNLAKNLLVTILEKLYEHRMIRFTSGADREFYEAGIEGHRWEYWRAYLYDDLKHLNINEAMIVECIDSWKKENSLKGDYASAMKNILKKLITMKKIEDTDEHDDEHYKLEEMMKSLGEKMEKLNPVEGNIQKVKNSGINAIIHGHTPKRENEQYYNENDLVIVSPHASLDEYNREHGIITIQKNGGIRLIGKNFRDKR